ncbi:ATP-binding protein [Stappia sp. F7233]|uniref:ATP-binding protein n=1 Tax=Stappia albiluteola TaxID=2758565 RepID=A0A839AFV4_9HYPH|nr:ATP-binding protein [Stappia albiluteola]
MVGPNNTGKSSILDALRIFSDVQRFASRRVPILKSYEGLGVCAAYEATNRIFSVTLENIATNYSSDFAKIIITNANDNNLHVYLNPDLKPEIFIQTDQRILKNKNFFHKCFTENVVVVPTLSQFEDSEKLNDQEYVRGVEYTRLAARNFRNIWRGKSTEEFEAFRVLVRHHWEGIDVSPPELSGGFPKLLQMFYREKGVSREIYWSGFGFQAWLQMMTHFLRGGHDSVLVLDEPDIYLHADLQRRLFHIAKKLFNQIFIATHSSEIMNEANASDVVLIKPGHSKGSRITSEAGYRVAHTLLGSSDNADFARLARAKRIIAFEGNDRTLFKKFEQKILKSGVLSDPDTLSIKIGGYENWRRIDNLRWMFGELFDIQAKIVSVFDRDYRCKEEIEEFERRLSDAGVICHVLRRKEIENYLLEFDPLSKAIERAAHRRNIIVNYKEIIRIIEEVGGIQKEDALINVQSFATKYYASKRDGRDPSTILKAAKLEFDGEWGKAGFKQRISGKQFIVDLNSRLRQRYGFSVTTAMIADEFDISDIDNEMIEIIHSINKHLS